MGIQYPFPKHLLGKWTVSVSGRTRMRTSPNDACMTQIQDIGEGLMMCVCLTPNSFLVPEWKTWPTPAVVEWLGAVNPALSRYADKFRCAVFVSVLVVVVVFVLVLLC